MNRARTYRCTRMRHCIEQSNGLVPSLLCPSWVDCIIATRGYDFRKGQVVTNCAYPFIQRMPACNLALREKLQRLCNRQRTFARAGRMAESVRKEGELEIRWCGRDKPRYAKMASLSVFGVGRQQFGRARITIIPGRVIRHIGNGQLPLSKQVARIHGAGQAIEKSGRIFRLRT